MLRISEDNVGGFTNIGSTIHSQVVNNYNDGSGSIQLQQLIVELALLRGELLRISNGDMPEYELAIGALKAAEISAGKSDQVSTFKFLKNAGKLALDLAIKIGTPVAVKALEAALRI